MPADDNKAAETTEKVETTAADTTKADAGGGNSTTTDTGDKATGDTKAAATSTATSLLDRDDDDDTGTDGGDRSGDDADKGTKTDDKGAFPDNWRETLAKGDAKLLDRLKRYTSYEAFAQAGLSAQDKIRSGEYKAAKLSEDATPEEVAAYREAHEIPEEPSKYDIPAVAGHTWTEADEPILSAFKEDMHKLGVPQPIMSGIASWYARHLMATKEQMAEQRTLSDRAHLEELDDTLRSEFGAEFKPSLKLVKRYLDDREQIDPAVAEVLSTARDNNGRRLINNPAVVRHLINTARDIYGDAALITGQERTNLNSRKAEIEKIRNEDIKAYYDQGLDKELLEINRRESGSGRRRG